MKTQYSRKQLVKVADDLNNEMGLTPPIEAGKAATAESLEEGIFKALKWYDPEVDVFQSDTQEILNKFIEITTDESYENEEKELQEDSEVMNEYVESKEGNAEETAEEDIEEIIKYVKSLKKIKDLREALEAYEVFEDGKMSLEKINNPIVMKKDMLDYLENKTAPAPAKGKAPAPAKGKAPAPAKEKAPKSAPVKKEKKAAMSRMDAVAIALKEHNPKTVEEWVKKANEIYGRDNDKETRTQIDKACKILKAFKIDFPTE